MLEVRNLTCGYGSNFSLSNIDFRVEEEELIGIIGPNGSGKTTLLRAISKAIKARNGAIFLGKENIKDLSLNHLAKKIAVVSQALDPDLKMSVEEFVLLGRIPHRMKWQFLETKEDENAALQAMVLTDTLKFKDRSMETLSGGERQLVLIARALAQEPKLLLLDEPTSHLDITHQVNILNLIKKLNKEKKLTVIIVLHDLNLAGEYCDRLVLINRGKLRKIGAAQEVLTYQLIEEVYKTIVVVKENPISKKPYVILVSQGKGEKNEKRPNPNLYR